MAQSGKSFAIQTAIYVVICLLVFLGFSFWRRAKWLTRFYAPKRHVRTANGRKPPRLMNKLGKWVVQVLYTSEAQMVEFGGVDAAVYMKILRMGFELFIIIGFFVCAVILPINVTGGEVENLMAANNTMTAQGTKYEFSDLDKLSMSNVADRSPRLYAHALMAWLVTIIFLKVLWKYNGEALRLRIHYLLNAPKGAESHTVLLTDVPGVLYGTKAERLDKTALRFLPASVKQRIKDSVKVVVDKASEQAEAVVAMASSSKRVTASPHPGPESGPSSKLESAASAESEAEAEAEAEAVVMSMVPPPLSPRVQHTAVPLTNYWREAALKLAGGDTVEEMISEEFKKIYGRELVKVHVVHDTSDLDPLVAEYHKLEGQLTDLVDDLVSKKRRGKKIKTPMTTVLGIKYGEWGKAKYGTKAKVPLLDWYRDRLIELWRLIGEEQDKSRKKDWPSAFVTFNSRKTQVECADALICQDLSAWITQPAPRPEEVYWPNLGWRAWERSLRSVGMWAAFVALMLFFMIPVTAVQSLLSLNSVVSFVNSIPIVGTFLTGILPSLALTIFLILLPTILRIMNIYQGMLSESEIDLGVVSRFFAFQVVTVFAGSFIAGSFANQIEQFIEDPGSIVTVLGTSAPQTAIFFMSYIQLQGFVVQPIGLLRLVPLIIFWLLSKLASTERAKARLWQNQEMSYGTLVPGDCIMMLLGVVFCIIQPLITPIAAVYFAVTYIVWKYQMLYVYGQPYQSGGQNWTRVFNQAMTGLFIFQLMMIFILSIKKMIAPSIICIPLPFLSIFFWKTVHAHFWRPQEKLSLMAAAELDTKEARRLSEQEGLVGPTDEQASHLYLSPSFKLSKEAHEALLVEVEKGEKLLKGEESSEDLEEPAVDLEAAASIPSEVDEVEEGAPAIVAPSAAAEQKAS